MIILSFFFLVCFTIIKQIKIALFLFITIFLAGSHKEIQQKYFSFMSIMHWNDGLKIYMSVPYNFYKKNYSKALRDFYLEDKGNNSDLNYIEDIFFLLKKHETNKIYVSQFFQKEINQSTLFKERIRETIYPSKIIISQESNNSQEKIKKKNLF